MQDFNLHAPAGANRKKRIIGRGQGSGRGTTAGKGNKGQQARSGGKTYLGFEGGQMPLYRRLARRGFSNYPFKKEYRTINLGEIDRRFADGETVDAAALAAKGFFKGASLIKILADGELHKRLSFKVDAVSAAAKEKIEQAGGTVTEKPPVEQAGKGKKAKKPASGDKKPQEKKEQK